MYNSELDTFLAVAEAGSFSKAAKKLYISTPAVVQQMNLLEKRLNVQILFHIHCSFASSSSFASTGFGNRSSICIPKCWRSTRPTPNAGNCSGHLKSPPLTALFTTCGKPRFSPKPSPSKSMQKAIETVLCFDRLSFAIKT